MRILIFLHISLVSAAINLNIGASRASSAVDVGMNGSTTLPSPYSHSADEILSFIFGVADYGIEESFSSIIIFANTSILRRFYAINSRPRRKRFFSSINVALVHNNSNGNLEEEGTEVNCLGNCRLDACCSGIVVVAFNELDASLVEPGELRALPDSGLLWAYLLKYCCWNTKIYIFDPLNQVLKVKNNPLIEKLIKSCKVYLTKIRHSFDGGPYAEISELNLIPFFGSGEIHESQSKFPIMNGSGPLASQQHSYLQQLSISDQLNFHNATLRAIGLDDPEYISELSFRQGASGKKELDGGLFADLVSCLMIALNFSITVVDGNGWISEANGTLTGIGAQLLNDEGDFTITFSQIVPYRAKRIYFVHQTFAGRDYAFFRQPDSTTMRNLFTSPFSKMLWVGLALLSFLALIVLWVASHVLRRWSNNGNPAASTIAYDQSEFDAFLYVVSILSQKGFLTEGFPTTWHVRLSMLSICSLSIICYDIYNALLVSSSANLYIPITTFNGLLDFNYTILTTPRVSLIDFYVSDSAQIAYLKEKSAQSYINESYSVYQVLTNRTQRFAYINTFDTFYLHAINCNLNDNQICGSFSMVSGGSNRNKCGMMIPKGSRLKEPFNVKILLIMERGLNARANQQYEIKETLRCIEKSVKWNEVGLPDVFSAFVLLAVAMIGSLVLIALEHMFEMCFACRNSKREREENRKWLQLFKHYAGADADADSRRMHKCDELKILW